MSSIFEQVPQGMPPGTAPWNRTEHDALEILPWRINPDGGAATNDEGLATGWMVTAGGMLTDKYRVALQRGYQRNIDASWNVHPEHAYVKSAYQRPTPTQEIWVTAETPLDEMEQIANKVLYQNYRALFRMPSEEDFNQVEEAIKGDLEEGAFSEYEIAWRNKVLDILPDYRYRFGDVGTRWATSEVRWAPQTRQYVPGHEAMTREEVMMQYSTYGVNNATYIEPQIIHGLFNQGSQEIGWCDTGTGWQVLTHRAQYRNGIRSLMDQEFAEVIQQGHINPRLVGRGDTVWSEPDILWTGAAYLAMVKMYQIYMPEFMHSWRRMLLVNAFILKYILQDMRDYVAPPQEDQQDTVETFREACYKYLPYAEAESQLAETISLLTAEVGPTALYFVADGNTVVRNTWPERLGIGLDYTNSFTLLRPGTGGEWFEMDGIFDGVVSLSISRDHDDLRFCYGCGERSLETYIYYNEYHDEFYCEMCDPGDYNDGEYNEDYIIQNYSFKPNPDFRSLPDEKPAKNASGLLYMGMELETNVHGDEQATARSMRDLLEQFGDASLFYFKDDASISNGWELVTHPFTPAWGLKNFPFKAFDEAIKTRLIMKEHRTCGQHIHVSKNAFTKAHLAKFLWVHDTLSDFVALVGGRDMNTGYANYHSFKNWRRDNPKALTQYATGKLRDVYSTGHGSAINLEGTQTIELRYPAGNVSPDNIRKNIEWIDCLFEFSRLLTVKDIKDLDPGYLVFFITANRKKYKQLNKWLAEKFPQPKAPTLMEVN